MKKFWRILLPLLTVLCLAFIFYNSLQGAGRSEERSKGIANAVSDRYEEVTQTKVRRIQRVKLDKVVRKIAHVAEYGAFAFFLTFSIFAFREKAKWLYLSVPVAGAAVGAADELLQGLTKGRSPAVKDVWLDLGGAMLGFVIAFVITLVIRRKRRKYELGVSVS